MRWLRIAKFASIQSVIRIRRTKYGRLIQVFFRPRRIICNSFPGNDMSAEVSCGLGFPEGAGKVDTTEANGRPHGLETAGGEAIKPAVPDPGDEAMAAELGDQT